jgi:RHS repeat-associated protein
LLIERNAVGSITGLTVAQGKKIEYTYDGRELVTSIKDWAGGTTTFTYDDAGELLQIDRPNQVSTQYQYDSDGRLISIVEGSISSITLTRNELGLLISAERDVPLAPRADSYQFTGSYDAACRENSRLYDANGRVFEDPENTYEWDLRDRLLRLESGSKSFDFGYDGIGSLLSIDDGTNKREFVINYATALPMIVIVREQNQDVRYYVCLPCGPLLYSLEADNNERRYYHYDEMGNTIFLTDENGSVANKYAYSSYGRLLQSEEPYENPFTYVGKYGVICIDGINLYNMRNRFYDAFTGRFLSKDQMYQLGPREINPYQYALENPCLFLDPDGTDVTTTVTKGAKTVKKGTGHTSTLTNITETLYKVRNALQRKEDEERWHRATKDTDPCMGEPARIQTARAGHVEESAKDMSDEAAKYGKTMMSSAFGAGDVETVSDIVEGYRNDDTDEKPNTPKPGDTDTPNDISPVSPTPNDNSSADKGDPKHGEDVNGKSITPKTKKKAEPRRPRSNLNDIRERAQRRRAERERKLEELLRKQRQRAIGRPHNTRCGSSRLRVWPSDGASSGGKIW